MTVETASLSRLVANPEFAHLASDEQVERTARALEDNGIRALVVDTAAEAREAVRRLLPPGAGVYDSRSRTLEQIGLAADLKNDASLHPVRARLPGLPPDSPEYRRLISAPDVLIGSVHAITERGQVLLASATGSQLASASVGAGKVIWIAGTQKIVPSLEAGLRRIQEYSYPLEDERARKAYGKPSAVNKILIVNGEPAGRITVILVKENLGF